MAAPSKRTNKRIVRNREDLVTSSFFDKISKDNNLAFVFIISILILCIIVLIMFLKPDFISTILTTLLAAFTGLIGYASRKLHDPRKNNTDKNI